MMDRKIGGAGVFILVRNDIDCNEGAFEGIITGSECEIVWAQVKLPGSKLLNVASLYRPPDSYIETMHVINRHLT